MRMKTKTICALVLALIFGFQLSAQSKNSDSNDKVYVFDGLRNESVDKAIGSSQVSSKRKGGILIALVLSDDPEFMQVVKNAMNDNIAAGRKKIMIVHGKGDNGKFSWVSLYANGKLGDSYYFDGKHELRDTGTKIFFSAKEFYEKEIEDKAKL